MKTISRRGTRVTRPSSNSTPTASPSNDGSGNSEFGTASEPNLEQLRKEFEWAVADRGTNLFSRLQTNYEQRMCWWMGKSFDGRKWVPKPGQDEVFPWPGASDLAVPLVDTYINKMVANLMVVWNRMRTVIHGTEANDDTWARRMTSFWRWMKYTQMEEARGENKLLCNYLLERGCAVMGVLWDKQEQLAYEEVDLEKIVTLVMERSQGGEMMGGESTPHPAGSASGIQGGEGDQTDGAATFDRFSELPTMILLPEYDAMSAQLLTELLPEATLASMKRVVKELRETGVSKYPRKTVVKNRPRNVALACNEDVFLARGTTSMADAPGVFWAEWVTETTLRGRVGALDWDADWVEAVIETQRGKAGIGSDLTRNGRNNQLTQQSSRGVVETENMFYIVNGYRRLHDAEGVPGIYCTVFSPGLLMSVGNGSHGVTSPTCPEYAKHELLNYAHGKMPFVLAQREKRSRRIDDSRGVGEIAGTLQSGIKAEVDQQIDRGSIATVPPSFHPPGEAPDKWGPGVQIGTSRHDAYGFFQPPAYDPQSEKNAVSLRRIGDEYFGFATDPENAQDSMALKQMLVDDFMDVQREIDTQGLQLCQQFMDDEFYFRVVGSAQGKGLHATREEIQGQFDLAIAFDVRMLDPEHASEVMSLIEQAMAMDVNGIVDHDETLAYVFGMVEPNLGERLLKPGESASLEQVEDEGTVFVKLMAGVPVAVKPGQAYQLRLQTLTQLLQNNPGAQQLVQNNENVKQAFEERVKGLQLQISQQQNAVRGRGGPAFQKKVSSQ